jgi:hypothetical protein
MFVSKEANVVRHPLSEPRLQPSGRGMLQTCDIPFPSRDCKGAVALCCKRAMPVSEPRL